MLLFLFSASAASPATPTDSGTLGPYYGHGHKFEYDRPHLSEYAEALRRAVQKNELKKAKELAEEIIEIADAIPPQYQAPQMRGLVDVASRLRHVDQLDTRTVLALVRTMIVRARAIERALDDEDAEILLLG